MLLNDPGRLISVHIVHTGLVAGWSAVMLAYECLIIDTTDQAYDPVWRQGCFVLPYASRLGVVTSTYHWSLGISHEASSWTYETVFVAHLILSGLLILASCWHWAFWDLNVFISSSEPGSLVLDLNRIFGIHLGLSSLLSLGFGLIHLTGFGVGPGMWTSDAFGLLGSVRYVKPLFSIIGLTTYSYGVISSNHIGSGVLGLILSVWHISTRPGPSIYQALVMGNIESVLASSLIAVFLISLITSSSTWYGSVCYPIELLGPTRFQWDNGYFTNYIERRASVASGLGMSNYFCSIPDKLVIYDYIGSNPAKGGLFRSGPMIKGDGIVQNWLGHAVFELGGLPLSIRRMPSFFETFPVLLLDRAGTVRSDIPFRRSEARFSFDQIHVSVYFQGGILDAAEYCTPSIVKSYARKAQLGEILSFDCRTPSSEGVLRPSSRSWYSFTHLTLSLLFILGHLWHSGRAYWT